MTLEIKEIGHRKITEKSMKPKVVWKYQQNWQTFSYNDEEKKGRRLWIPTSRIKEGTSIVTLKKYKENDKEHYDQLYINKLGDLNEQISIKGTNCQNWVQEKQNTE